MKYRVTIKQEDMSTKVWTLTELMRYLRLVLRRWALITVTWNDTVIEIERVK